MTAGKGKPPIALTWFRALTDHFAEEVRPRGGAAIVAVAAVLMKYADSDGTRADVGQRRLQQETCQHWRRVSEALAWLADHGWITIEGRKGPHGEDKRTLTIPPSVSTVGDAASVAPVGDAASVAPVGDAEPPASHSASHSASHLASPTVETNLLSPISDRREEEIGSDDDALDAPALTGARQRGQEQEHAITDELIADLAPTLHMTTKQATEWAESKLKGRRVRNVEKYLRRCAENDSPPKPTRQRRQTKRAATKKTAPKKTTDYAVRSRTRAENRRLRAADPPEVCGRYWSTDKCRSRPVWIATEKKSDDDEGRLGYCEEHFAEVRNERWPWRRSSQWRHVDTGKIATQKGTAA